MTNRSGRSVPDGAEAPTAGSFHVNPSQDCLRDEAHRVAEAHKRKQREREEVVMDVDMVAWPQRHRDGHECADERGERGEISRKDPRAACLAEAERHDGRGNDETDGDGDLAGCVEVSEVARGEGKAGAGDLAYVFPVEGGEKGQAEAGDVPQQRRHTLLAKGPESVARREQVEGWAGKHHAEPVIPLVVAGGERRGTVAKHHGHVGET